MAESARASASAAPALPPRTLVRSRETEPRIPMRVHRQGTSTSCVSATAKRAPRQRGGSSPRRVRNRSNGGSSRSSPEEDAGKGPCRSRSGPRDRKGGGEGKGEEDSEVG